MAHFGLTGSFMTGRWLSFLITSLVVSACTNGPSPEFEKRYHRELADKSIVKTQALFAEGACEIEIKNDYSLQKAKLDWLDCELIAHTKEQQQYLDEKLQKF